MPKIYQVFIGCPFLKDIRRNYDRLKKELEAESPISIVLADTVGVSSSDYLLEHITGLIQDSAGCIFDATGANPNVSLEVGADLSHSDSSTGGGDLRLLSRSRGDSGCSEGCHLQLRRDRMATSSWTEGHDRRSGPSNNEMSQTKPAIARMARSSLLISVMGELFQKRVGSKGRR